jgi:antitoxin component YwqK of YwqJK toxin-antitoxin module
MEADLNIAVIPYDTGEVHYRYARYLSSDGTRWIRHGLFRAYHRNGVLASEGNYVDGLEEGLWCDFHENGQLAARGTYAAGQEKDDWVYWNSDGAIDTEEKV